MCQAGLGLWGKFVYCKSVYCMKLTLPQSSHATAVEQVSEHVKFPNAKRPSLLCLQYSPEPADAGILLGCRVQLGASGQENEQGSVELAAQHAVSQPPGQQALSCHLHMHTPEVPQQICCAAPVSVPRATGCSLADA